MSGGCADIFGQITDRQLDDALRSSGATDEEELQFRTAIRERINQLQRVAQS